MRSGGTLPGDQAELVFSDVLLEQLEDLDHRDAESVLVSIVRLCENTAGTHPLHQPLAGWNTLEVLARNRRVVYRAGTVDGVGLIDALCLGSRSGSEVYDLARALVEAGLLTDETATQIWEALALLEIVAEQVGLDGWDYRPEPAPEGLQRAVVAAGILPPDIAAVLSQDEILAAQTQGWGSEGPSRSAALEAALRRVRTSATYEDRIHLERRKDDRCDVIMPRAKAACIRVRGHPGAHRAR